MCAAPALTPAARTARTARAAPAFFGLQTLFDLLRPRDNPAIDLLVDVGFGSPMQCAVRLRALRGSFGVPALERVWAFEPLAFCASPVPGTLSPLSPPSHSVATARVHASFLSHIEARYLRSSVRYCHSGLFPPRRQRSFLPLSPPHSNVPTVYTPSIRASAHSPSISSFTSNRPRCACERIAKGE